MITFTAQDQEMLNDLTHRKAVADWAAREEQRLLHLAAISDIAAVFTHEAIAPIVECAVTQQATLETVDPALAVQLGHIATVMGYGGVQLVELTRRLETPEPEPVAVDTADPQEA